MENQKRARKIGILGSQLFISAIGASLAENPEFIVKKIEDPFPCISVQPGEDSPDVILFDLSANQPQSLITLIHNHPATLVIGADLANRRMVAYCGRESRLLTMEDLLREIRADR